MKHTKPNSPLESLIYHHYPENNKLWIVKGVYNKYVGGGGWRVLQIFQEIFRSPGDHRAKYFMAQ